MNNWCSSRLLKSKHLPSECSVQCLPHRIGEMRIFMIVACKIVDNPPIFYKCVFVYIEKFPIYLASIRDLIIMSNRMNSQLKPSMHLFMWEKNLFIQTTFDEKMKTLFWSNILYTLTVAKTNDYDWYWIIPPKPTQSILLLWWKAFRLR